MCFFPFMNGQVLKKVCFWPVEFPFWQSSEPQVFVCPAEV